MRDHHHHHKRVENNADDMQALLVHKYWSKLCLLSDLEPDPRYTDNSLSLGNLKHA